ncbi:Carboxyl-terminal-processing peptidase 1, chloroplastic, partial [Mucuna pruriens]
VKQLVIVSVLYNGKRLFWTVIYTVGRDPQLQKAIVTDTSPLIQAPVVVASALHDNCRAVLVGKRTYGKGLIQSVFELDDGSGVVITVGKYVTPNHKDINGNGIEPDFQKLPESACWKLPCISISKF